MSTYEKDFVDNNANADSIAETNLDSAKEDKITEESEVSGKVSKEEVEGLKDSIGGGEVLDDSEGYTRSSNKDSDALKGEKELDKAVDALE